MNHFLKLSFIRNRLFKKAAHEFIVQRKSRGIEMRGEDTFARIYTLRTVLVEADLLMQGHTIVRRIAAPLEVADRSRFKHQKAWMVLAAGISLGCHGYAPLASFAREHNFARERMLRQYPCIGLLPYDDARQMETTIHRDGDGIRAYTMGDVHAVLGCCTHVLDGKERLITPEDREKAAAAALSMEGEGLDTIAFATRRLSKPPEGDAYEEGMIFVGVVGTGDLPVADAAWTMESMRGAGARPVLVSDGTVTAGACRGTGTLRPEAGLMDAAEMDGLDEAGLIDAVQHADAYLQMDEARRVRLMEALSQEGPVARLMRAREGEGLWLLFAGEEEPEVSFARVDLGLVVRFLGDCRALCTGFEMET